MKIEALKDIFTSSHSLKKGDIVDIRKSDADILIIKKLAKVVKTKKGGKDG